MNNLKLITIIVLLPLFLINPQSNIVSGLVFDSVSAKPLTGANIVFNTLYDSTTYGAASDKDGRFTLRLPQTGKYLYYISFIGYETLKGELTLKGENVNLGKILLPPTTIETGEVEVVGKILPVQFKGDTTEYHTDAFKTTPDATALDLLTSATFKKLKKS